MGNQLTWSVCLSAGTPRSVERSPIEYKRLLAKDRPSPPLPTVHRAGLDLELHCGKPDLWDRLVILALLQLCIPPYVNQRVWKAVGSLKCNTVEVNTVVSGLPAQTRQHAAVLPLTAWEPLPAELPPLFTSHHGNEKLGHMVVSLCTAFHPVPSSCWLTDIPSLLL